MDQIEKCIAVNIELYKSDLIIDTFGNVSQKIDDNHFGIKPSGVDPSEVSIDDLPVINIVTGEKVSGYLNPSSDTPTHLNLYRSFPSIGGIVHTHSLFASTWAQASKNIPNLGTTHSDYWENDIPVTRSLTENEVLEDYEYNTGVVLSEIISQNSKSALNFPGALVRHHGPFTWGKDCKIALKNARLLEFTAKLAYQTLQLNKDSFVDEYIVQKHYKRKNGPDAYYGQKTKG
jgi:L-ribulose-5-phosphate 4-epimerase